MPEDVETSIETERQIWLTLDTFFSALGFRSWVFPSSGICYSMTPNNIQPAQNGYLYINESVRESGDGTLKGIQTLDYKVSYFPDNVSPSNALQEFLVSSVSECGQPSSPY
jgi:hypothetical protein